LVKKNQQMEEQIVAFAGTTAGSVVVAAGILVVGIPYAIKYLVKAAEEQALPYAAMLGSAIGDQIAAHGKATAEALKKKKADIWHEANPDVTQQDIDVPARSGDPYTDYLKEVGLPLSTVLVLVTDKEAIAAYQHSGEFDLYFSRIINGQHYYIIVPKGIKVYIKVDKVIWESADEHGLCNVGFETTTRDAQGFPLPPGAVGCKKTITESVLLTPSGWP